MPSPVHIDHEYERVPWATLGLIAGNVLFFVLARMANEEDVLPYVLQMCPLRVRDRPPRRNRCRGASSPKS